VSASQSTKVRLYCVSSSKQRSNSGSHRIFRMIKCTHNFKVCLHTTTLIDDSGILTEILTAHNQLKKLAKLSTVSQFMPALLPGERFIIDVYFSWPSRVASFIW
jgi:hypothetical protein